VIGIRRGMIDLRRGMIDRRWENLGGRLRPNDVARIIKYHVAMLDDRYDPADSSGHNLRRGTINSAKRRGYDRGDIMPKTGHRSHAAFDAYEHEEGCGSRFSNFMTA
jgi:hypothetical protein